MIADQGTRGSALSKLCRDIVQLIPPQGVVFDFSGGALPFERAASTVGGKVVSTAWDFATARGRGRLGAAVVGGEVWTIVFGVFILSTAETI